MSDRIPEELMAKNLPKYRHVWELTDCSETEKEIKADIRRAKWVEKCKA